jgi:hypothetical protein
MSIGKIQGPPRGGSIKASDTDTDTDIDEKEKAKAKNDAWQNVMNASVGRMNAPGVKGSLSYLGEGRINEFKARVQKDMEAYVDQNPDATPAEVKAYAEKNISKYETDMVLQKMRDDNFFSKLMNRRKELAKDLWG